MSRGDGAPADTVNLDDLDAAGRTTRPAGRPARVRTPEQIERDRARSRAWHARQRAIVAQVQATTPAGRRPVARPDGAPDAPLSSDERAELEALRAEVAQLRVTLARLEARIDNDRQRSRRNARRRRQRSTSGRLPLSSRVPARDQHGRHAAGTPPALPAVNTPPESSSGVFGHVPTITTTTPGAQGGARRHQPTADPDAVWQSPEVLSAAAARPGLDLALLRIKARDWLQRHPHVRPTVALALAFIERWQPPRAVTTARSGPPLIDRTGQPAVWQLPVAVEAQLR